MKSVNAPTAPGRAPIPAARARPAIGRRHLCGPIPIDWLAAAARLPGRSLHVGVALWITSENYRLHTVPLSNLASLRFGLDRNAKYRALAWLEEAGLIVVQRKLGRAPVITILDRGSEP